MDLRTTVTLLPTPTQSDGTGGGMAASPKLNWEGTTQSTGEGGNSRLRDVVGLVQTQWGKYEPAIRRWEQLTRPAPPPTEPNKNGNPRLAAAFSEWLMGWPDGWVTDPAIGISRNDQLKILGNGVVVQQAIAALRYLLAVAQ
jgi:DNA (cytosine-5)-methyltransferase 1